MPTLPQINLYTHGTQWAASSHGHLALFGAYVTIIVALAVQKLRGDVGMSGGFPQNELMWKRTLQLMHVRMTIALLIAGYEQAFVERAQGGAIPAYFAGQTQPWFVQAMRWRTIFGIVMTGSVLILMWDFLRIGLGNATEARSQPRHRSGCCKSDRCQRSRNSSRLKRLNEHHLD